MQKNSIHPKEIHLFRETIGEVKTLEKVAPKSKMVKSSPALIKPAISQKSCETFPSAEPTLFLSDAYTESLSPEFNVRYLAESKNLSAKITRTIQQGEYPIDLEIDLHGHTIESAREKILKELPRAYNHKKRLLLIVHGKGENGKLKTHVNHWLKQIPWVLFFCSAKPKNGGTGALYVFIKKNKLAQMPADANRPLSNNQSCQKSMVRKKIDALDKQITILLCERLIYAKKMAELKKTTVQDQGREQDILKQVTQQAEDLGYSGEYIKEIFESILAQMRKYQRSST